MATTKVKIVNMEPDRKFFEIDVLDADGTPRRTAAGKPDRQTLVLGSTEDRGVADCAQPEIIIDGEAWDALARMPAIRGWLETARIAVYPMAS